MPDARKWIECLNQQLPSTLELLKRMVAINSFTTNRAGVNQLGKLTADAFASLGFSPEFVPSAYPSYGDHVVLTRRGRSGRAIGLISHLDTVFPPEEEIQNQFFWREEGDRIYGPGTMDIKGGTVLIWMMLRAMEQFAPDAFDDTTWIILLDASEEALSCDFGHLCVERLGGGRALAALVFEAGGRAGQRYQVVTARKGRATFRVKAEGRGAHAGGQHERGINAIVQIAETIQRIAALTDYSRQLTFNVGAVSGGTVVNRVPHVAVADVEMRAFSKEAYQSGLEAMRSLAGAGTVKSAADGQQAWVMIEVTAESPPWPRNPDTERLLQIWQGAGRELGLSVLREERGGLSDANFIWQAVPTLDGLGPCGDNCHCSQRSADGTKLPEYVEPSSFAPKAALNILAILSLLK